jgi:membrane protein YqaA with SNARE-associated domain
MTDLGLAAIIIVAAAQGGVIGYFIGRAREKHRLIPEILDERDRANRLSLLLKLHGGKP